MMILDTSYPRLLPPNPYHLVDDGSIPQWTLLRFVVVVVVAVILDQVVGMLF